MKKLLACLLVVATSGCPDVKTDPGEGPGELTNPPTVEFDPAAAIIPFPNNLVINPATGKVNIPSPACETPAAKAVREGVLNQLDGFGTFEAAMQVTFTDDVDMSTVNDQTVVMYQRTSDGTPVTTVTPVPVAILPSTALRFDKNNCTAAPAQIHAITIVPKVPLQQRSTYTVALLSGIKTTTGKDYQPSFTWALVRQSVDPVTLADGCDYSNPTSCTIIAEKTPLTPGGDANGNGVPDVVEIVGLDQLWHAEAQALALLDPTIGNDRSKVLVAWEVTTQTTTDPLDPAVAGSPASSLSTLGLLNVFSIASQKAGGNSTALIEGFLQAAGLAQTPQQAAAICGQIGCDNVGDVLGGGLSVPSYQTHVMNAYSGAADVPGPWSDPVHPAMQDGFVDPSVGIPGFVSAIAFIPKGQPPATGWPTVVFGHGLGSQKESLFVFGPQLASAGFASVAIDFVDHGARAVRTSADASLGCAGHCSATTATACGHDSDCPTGATPETCVLPAFGTSTTQCFAPFLSTDLAATRDNIRETILDLQRLTNALKTCGAAGCGSLSVDPAHIEYTGISLGGIIGSTTTAVSPNIKTAVLNVPGMGWVDIFENTANLTIRCGVVDGLIEAGILQGDLWNGATDSTATGLCTTDAWKTSPAYQQFSGIARIVLDPADGANFANKLAPKRFLIQEVINDEVVPNIATNDEGALVGLMPQAADPYAPNNPGVPTGASMAILTNIVANKWLTYTNLPATDAATGGFGNAFQHASLLSPVSPLVAPGHCAGDPATACVQDATCQGAGGNVCVFPGTLGTARVQTDAITYLLGNK